MKSARKQSKFGKSLVVRPQNERGSGREKYHDLNTEVIQLRAEVMALRVRSDELESEMESVCAPGASALPVQMSEKKLQRLREVVNDGRVQIREMRAEAKQRDTIIADYKQKIRDMAAALSHVKDEKLEKRLEEVKMELQERIKEREQMKLEERELCRQVFPTEAEVNDAPEIKALKSELLKALTKEREARNRLKITERKQKEAECSLQELPLKLSGEQLTTIFVGLFEQELTEDQILDVFSEFGEVIDVTLRTCTHSNQIYYGFEINYGTHEQAKIALQSMHGQIFQSQPLVILWSAASFNAAIREPQAGSPTQSLHRSPRHKSSWETSSSLALGPVSSFDYVQDEESSSSLDYSDSDELPIISPPSCVLRPVLDTLIKNISPPHPRRKPNAERRLTNICIEMPDDLSDSRDFKRE